MEMTYTCINHQRQLVDNLCRLWKEAQFCDATIGVGPAIFMFHKLVYAATTPDYMKLSDCTGKLHFQFSSDVSLAAVESILTFLYTGQLKLSTTYLESVEKIADKMLLRCKVSPFIECFKQGSTEPTVEGMCVTTDDVNLTTEDISDKGTESVTDPSASGAHIEQDASSGACNLFRTIKSEPFSVDYEDSYIVPEDIDNTADFTVESMEVVSSSTNVSGVALTVNSLRGRGRGGRGRGRGIRGQGIIGGRGRGIRGSGRGSRGRGISRGLGRGSRGRGISRGLGRGSRGRGISRGLGRGIRGHGMGRGRSRGGYRRGRGRGTANAVSQPGSEEQKPTVLKDEEVERDGTIRRASSTYVPSSFLTEEQLNVRRERQREYYMRNKFKFTRLGRLQSKLRAQAKETESCELLKQDATITNLLQEIQAHKRETSVDIKSQQLNDNGMEQSLNTVSNKTVASASGSNSFVGNRIRAAFNISAMERVDLKPNTTVKSGQMSDNQSGAVHSPRKRGQRKRDTSIGSNNNSPLSPIRKRGRRSTSNACLCNVDSTDSHSSLNSPAKRPRGRPRKSSSPALSKNLVVKLVAPKHEPVVVLKKFNPFSSLPKPKATLNDTGISPKEASSNTAGKRMYRLSGQTSSGLPRQKAKRGRKRTVNVGQRVAPEKKRASSTYVPVRFLTEVEREERAAVLREKMRQWRAQKKALSHYSNDESTSMDESQDTSTCTSDWADVSTEDHTGTNGNTDTAVQRGTTDNTTDMRSNLEELDSSASGWTISTENVAEELGGTNIIEYH